MTATTLVEACVSAGAVKRVKANLRAALAADDRTDKEIAAAAWGGSTRSERVASVRRLSRMKAGGCLTVANLAALAHALGIEWGSLTAPPE